jgi:L,D-transpeptidase YbiS
MIIKIIVPTQQLLLLDQDVILRRYSISTAKKGMGQIIGSNKTPSGWHQIRAKIGAGSPANAVFVGRRFTGEIYTPELAKKFPERDWILTRILWLSGLEKGSNRLGDVDSMRRYIYIHGSPDEAPMGCPQSHGCIRMRNQEIMELFDLIPIGIRVLITDGLHAIN